MNATQAARRPDAYRQRVQDVMATNVVSVHPQATLEEALALLVENRLSALPVVAEKGRCVGILSATDLLSLEHELAEELGQFDQGKRRPWSWLIEKLSKQGVGQMQVQEVMTASLLTARPGTPLQEVARLMWRRGVHRLVVLSDREELVGIVSTMDILRAFAGDGLSRRARRSSARL